MFNALSEINPPTKRQAEYIRRIQLALKFIDAHLDESIRLDDVAKASSFSPFHFHRLFQGMLGETINDYITRKRMERAVKRLVYQSDLSVTDVALMGGFSSGANFSKAFKLYFGISPSELRNPEKHKHSKIGKLFSKYGKAFDPQELYPQFVARKAVFNSDKLKDLLMNIKINDLPEKQFAYLTSPGGYELSSVYSTWEKVLKWAENKGIDTSMDKRFALCHDNPAITPTEKCRYDASIVVDSDTVISAPYASSKIPAGKYAVAYFKDDAEKINHFMTEVCSNWFVNSGYEPDNYPPMFNYLNDTKKDGFVEMEVYIKVKELQISS